MSRSYRDLIAWQKAMQLVTDVYRFSESFPKHELYGLASQIRRSAVSVPSNIAEGQAKNSPREFLQFLGYAKGSLVELETQIQIAENLGYGSPQAAEKLMEKTEELGRILNGLSQSLKTPRAAAAGTKN